MTTGRRLTVEWLREFHACEDQLAIFAREWPDGVIPTVAAVQRALDLDLDVMWVAQHCFSTTAWADYKQARNAALRVYDQVDLPLRATYESRSTAWAAYEQAHAAAWISAWDSTTSEAGGKKIE